MLNVTEPKLHLKTKQNIHLNTLQ